MSREEIIAANPIVKFVRRRGHKLKEQGENFVTNACPITRHSKRGHTPVTIYPATQTWTCHDCKQSGSVIDWVMREEHIGVRRAMRKLGGMNDSEIVATYDYTDENGKLLFQTVRLKPKDKPKDFYQRQPDGKGGWRNNIKDVRRVLYRLHEVVKAQIVCLPEGEKDVDNLRELGFVATTNPMGAGKWRKEYAEALRRKDVVVFGDVGDSDGSGEKHTAKRLASLIGVARSLKHAKQPDGFHDISDYIDSLRQLAANDHASIVQTIRELIETTPLYEAKAQQSDKSESDAEDEEIRRLAEMSLPKYEKARKDAAKKLGFRPSILDRLVNAERLRMRPRSETDNLQGEVVKLTDVEPWPEPVNGAEILDAITRRFLDYVVMPQAAAFMLALWCALTHIFKLFQISPRLNICAPMPECGKTTLRDCASLFCARSFPTDNMTTAAMFRLVSGHFPTVLADECDKWLFTNEELIGLICSGHRKSGRVIRCEGDSNELRQFRCYAPILLAAIGALPSQLHSRSISIRLERAKREEIKKCSRFDEKHVEYEQELNRKLARWIADNRDRIESCKPKLPEHLFNRIADNWWPLFVIAAVAGGDWPQRCAHALIKLTTCEDEADSLRVMLLADIKEMFTAERMFSKELVATLVDLKERPWPEVCRGKPITERWLARNLIAFDVHSKTLRIGEERAKGYERTDFDEAFSRYLPDTPLFKRDSVTDEGKLEISSVTKGEVVTDTKNESCIGRKGICHAVTDKRGEVAGDTVIGGELTQQSIREEEQQAVAREIAAIREEEWKWKEEQERNRKKKEASSTQPATPEEKLHL
jgi:putative DNA primase/helicase